MFLIHDRRLFSKIGFILLEESFCKKSVSTRSDGASILSGHDNLFNVCFQERRTALRCRARHKMAIIALAVVGLFGGGFMLYVLFQWTRETVRRRNQ
jgi:hypothetical protein